MASPEAVGGEGRGALGISEEYTSGPAHDIWAGPVHFPPTERRVGQEGGSPMAKMRVLSARGDTVLEWDERKLQTGDPEALAAVREAEWIFEELRSRGATAFKVESDKPGQRLDTVDRTAEQIIVVPRVAGG